MKKILFLVLVVFGMITILSTNSESINGDSNFISINQPIVVQDKGMKSLVKYVMQNISLEYLEGIDKISFIKVYQTPVIIRGKLVNGWYHTYWDSQGNIYYTEIRIYIFAGDINKSMEYQEQYKYLLLHELGHHYWYYYLGNRVNNEEYANNFTNNFIKDDKIYTINY